MTWNTEDYEHLHYLCSPDSSTHQSTRSSSLMASEREYDTCQAMGVGLGGCMPATALPPKPQQQRMSPTRSSLPIIMGSIGSTVSVTSSDGDTPPPAAAGPLVVLGEQRGLVR